MNRIIAALSLILAATSVSAQSSVQPFVKLVPDNASWTITVDQISVNEEAEKQPQIIPSVDNSEIKQIRITKVGNTIFYKVTRTDGTEVETWWADGYLLDTPKQWPFIRVLSEAAIVAIDPGFSVPGKNFPGFDWLEAKYLTGRIRRGNTNCLHYVDAKKGREALVDAESLMPVEYKDAYTRQVYEFASASGQKLQLPKPYAEALKSYQKAVKR